MNEIQILTEMIIGNNSQFIMNSIDGTMDISITVLDAMRGTLSTAAYMKQFGFIIGHTVTEAIGNNFDISIFFRFGEKLEFHHGLQSGYTGCLHCSDCIGTQRDEGCGDGFHRTQESTGIASSYSAPSITNYIRKPLVEGVVSLLYSILFLPLLFR